MKRLKCLILSGIMSVVLLSGCGTGPKTEPFKELRESYENGSEKVGIETSDYYTYLLELSNSFETCFTAYSEFINEKEGDLAAGLKFSELEGYDDAVKPIYEWSIKAAFLDTEDIPDSYREYIEIFSDIGDRLYHDLNATYNMTADEAEGTISSMTNYIVTNLNRITEAFVPKELKVNQLLTCPNYANVRINSISYELAIFTSDYNTNNGYLLEEDINKEYLAIQFDYYNLQKQTIYDLDQVLSYELVYESGYEYNGFWVVEDHGKLTYTPKMIPLSEYKCWYLFEVPTSIISEGYNITLNINGESYKLKPAD